jgi:RNA polymerase sigma-70 factor (ECF subfamily)
VDSRYSEGEGVVREVPPWESEVARRRCLREARRILRDREDAEEAVQEALIRAWRSREACRTPASRLPWLVQITRNEALRLAERRSRRRASEIPDDRSETHADECGLDRTIDTVATQQALRALRPEDRHLIHLRYVEDLTQGQVAARVGMPEGTVKVRLHRARVQLRGAAAELAA